MVKKNVWGKTKIHSPLDRPPQCEYDQSVGHNVEY